MRKSPLYTVGLLLLIIVVMYSCTKNNGIDNNQVIETPYSLFFADSSGAVYKSNDGMTDTIIFHADGYPCRALCTQNSNIFIVKDQLYISTNNGQNFSLSLNTIDSLTTTDCNNLTVGLNQSMIINIPQCYRIYVVSNNALSSDYLGQETSVTGAYGSWYVDGQYDTLRIGALPVQTISYAQLSSGVVASLAIKTPILPTGNVYRNFYANSNFNYWIECTGGANGAPEDTSGTSLPGSGFFTLGHLNNRLIAIDSKCTNGAWYSDDTGRNWFQYAITPANTSLLCICSPFEENCFIGSSAGLYELNQNTGTFQLNTNGLTSDLIVRGITYKENIYKTGTTQKFIYLATNKGIYQSVDGGSNWILTIRGNFTTIY